jgi:hypothetical protein
MKKILLYSGLVILVFATSLPEAFSQSVREHLKLKGVLSSNSENEDSEADPAFKELAAPEGFKKRTGSVGNEQQVSKMENGLQIVKDIIDKMISKEYGFSLLSQHKYMINSCLGFKVSAGEFNVKFYNPVSKWAIWARSL